MYSFIQKFPPKGHKVLKNRPAEMYSQFLSFTFEMVWLHYHTHWWLYKKYDSFLRSGWSCTGNKNYLFYLSISYSFCNSFFLTFFFFSVFCLHPQESTTPPDPGQYGLTTFENLLSALRGTSKASLFHLGSVTKQKHRQDEKEMVVRGQSETWRRYMVV